MIGSSLSSTVNITCFDYNGTMKYQKECTEDKHTILPLYQCHHTYVVDLLHSFIYIIDLELVVTGCECRNHSIDRNKQQQQQQQNVAIENTNSIHYLKSMLTVYL
ncbi:hypothetical protein DERP_002301 [Dermatophagoides pteronyssinus]|uniref:Uncharacterized protein n=1 Tax=Dermatophagoides pteronyssinus TaxID=6956 RepID=A0ABQ8JHF2_DERPT|nr:hypothetical protein DERP_002301 [Dermatophagoides pteronyssinus]